jgi:hypothetical protein
LVVETCGRPRVRHRLRGSRSSPRCLSLQDLVWRDVATRSRRGSGCGSRSPIAHLDPATPAGSGCISPVSATSGIAPIREPAARGSARPARSVSLVAGRAATRSPIRVASSPKTSSGTFARVPTGRLGTGTVIRVWLRPCQQVAPEEKASHLHAWQDPSRRRLDLMERHRRVDRRCGHRRRRLRPGESCVYRDGSQLDEVVDEGCRSI